MIYRRSILLIIILFFSFTPLLAQQRGKATYYSKRATGARTSSGERLHHDSLTCAHRTYPFGSLLKVTNPSNDKSVVVRVTDRGPFSRGKIIDLSWRAANELDIISKGVATVVVELVSTPDGGIPYINDMTMALPEMDFKVAEAGYSFIEEWKGDAKSNDISNESTANAQRLAKTKRQSRAATTKPATQQKRQRSQKENTSNKWSAVFEKIKKLERRLVLMPSHNKKGCTRKNCSHRYNLCIYIKETFNASS